jgi:hypothetical protein
MPQRLNIFFILILPLLIITLLGAAFGSSAAHLGVVAGDGPLAAQAVDHLELQANLDVHRYGSERAASSGAAPACYSEPCSRTSSRPAR